jgi:hypothetical protein
MKTEKEINEARKQYPCKHNWLLHTYWLVKPGTKLHVEYLPEKDNPHNPKNILVCVRCAKCGVIELHQWPPYAGRVIEDKPSDQV